MQAIILAGGLGTRLSGVVNDRPKPMAMIIHKPFVEYILDGLRMSGITDIVFAVGYKGEMIEQYFGNGSDFGMRIEYAYEKELLGTAGALKNALKYIRSEDVLVLNGDTYYQMDFFQFVKYGRNHQSDMCINLRWVPDISRYAYVTMDGERILAFNEKVASHEPGIINGGVYYLKSKLLHEIPDGKVSLENQMIPKWLNDGKKITGLTCNQYFIDIGIPNDYYRFIEDKKRENQEMLASCIAYAATLENVTATSPQLLQWKSRMIQCIINTFGINSDEYKWLTNTSFEPSKINNTEDSREILVKVCHERIREVCDKYQRNVLE